MLFLLLFIAGQAMAGDAPAWNSFRGPNAGVSPWSSAPAAWNGKSGAGILWKTKLAMPGLSSPVLWKDRGFLIEGDEKERAVLAFSADTGKLLWRRVVADGAPKEPLPSVSDYGLALPTPACDEDGVYALFGTGDLAAFSSDGAPRWQRFFHRPVLGYGFASSPCVADHLLLLQFDDLTDGFVMAVDTRNGETRWQHSRSRGAAWSSPMLIPGPGQHPLFLVNANGSLTAFDLQGHVVWDIDGVTGDVAPSPAYGDDRIYAVNDGSALLCYANTDSPTLRWRYDGTPLSNACSPVALNGLCFMVTSDAHLVCLDGQTGTVLWSHDNPACYASLLAAGDRLYALSRDGVMNIVAAARQYQLLAACSLGEHTDATPACADGRLYIRGREYLWCIGK